ncbi:MAG: hypothetical protein IJT54_02490 [Candidatus Methanomethylophilaceae archaeon]|nr:hypothetical protein [Candidatus Methanomethylophilaceae archaeon]
MRRIGDVYHDIVKMENLELAARKACSSRRDRDEVAAFLKDREKKLKKLQQSLLDHSYHTSPYRMFDTMENGKLRHIADLPLFPDRIFHWAIALALEDRLNAKLIDQTHGSRPGHGIHSAIEEVRGYIRHDDRIRYYLKMDVSKFFPSIDKAIMKSKLRDVIKDRELLFEFDKLVDEYPESGLPIGNRTSPMLANLYLSQMDHAMKEIHHCHYYTRYIDDILILGYSKEWLHKIRNIVVTYLEEIGLKMKGNWCIRPITEGIDYVGYRIFPEYTLLRKRTATKIKAVSVNMLSRLEQGKRLTKHDYGTISSYKGSLKWCNGYNLYRSTIWKVERKAQENNELRKAAFAWRSFYKEMEQYYA